MATNIYSGLLWILFLISYYSLLFGGCFSPNLFLILPVFTYFNSYTDCWCFFSVLNACIYCCLLLCLLVLFLRSSLVLIVPTCSWAVAYTIVYNNESFLCTSQVWTVSKILSKSPTSCHLLVATVSFAFEGSAAVLLRFG